jgi:hypothetical protein
MCQRLKQKMRPLPVWRIDRGESELHAKKSSIRFGSVEIREYNRELGAYSDVDLDYGLALGWGYQQRPAIPLDQHQIETRTTQISKSLQNGGLQRVAKKMSSRRSSRRRVGVAVDDKKKKKKTKKKSDYGLQANTTSERRNILRGFGYSREEISEAEFERRLHGLPFTDKIEIILRRTIQKIIC